MPSDHAKISPSGVAQVVACPGSYQAQLDIPDTTNPAAERGTHLHECAEYCNNNDVPADDYMAGHDPEEDIVAVQTCLDFTTEELATYPTLGCCMEFEKRQEIPTVAPWFYGTIDVACWVPEERGTVCDYKFGQGYVSVVENLQLISYGIGLMEEFALKECKLMIVQPALPNPLSEWTLGWDDMKHWSGVIQSALEEALSDKPERNASPAACRWCRAKGKCRAYITSELAYFANLIKSLEFRHV